MKFKSFPDPVLRYGPALFMLAAIPALSLLPARLFKPLAAVPRLPGADKIIHALLYAALALSFFRTLPAATRGRWFAAASIAGVAALYGLAMELCQRHLTSSRSFDILDAVANTVGALAYSAIACSWYRRRILNNTAP